MTVDSLEKELESIARENQRGLDEVNVKFRSYTCDKSPETKDQSLQKNNGNILEKMLCGEFGEFLHQDPLQVETKYFNSLEVEFFDKYDWAIQESMFEQMKHDMQKRVEVSHRSEFDFAMRY